MAETSAKMVSPSKIGMFIFLLGVNLYYIMAFVYPLSEKNEVIGSFRYYFGFYSLILLGMFVLALPILRKSITFKVELWFIGLACVIVDMTAISILESRSLDTIIVKMFPYVTLGCAMVIARYNNLWRFINKFIVLHAYIGIIYFVIIMYLNGLSYSIVIDILELNAVPASLYSTIYVLMTFAYQNKIGRLAGVLGLGVQVLYLILVARKFILFIIPVEVLLLSIILIKTGLLKEIGFKIVAGVILCFIILLSLEPFIIRGEKIDLIKQSFQTGYGILINRWGDKGSSDQTIVRSDRWEELRVVSSQMTPIEWIIGKGADAHWKDVTFIYRGQSVRPNVHFSYMDFIFRGGIVLLAIMLVPLSWAYRVFKVSTDPLTLGAAGFALVGYLNMLSFNMANMGLSWLLLSLCIGRCFWATHDPARQIQKGSRESRQGRR